MARVSDGKTQILDRIALAYAKDYRRSFKRSFKLYFRLTKHQAGPATDELRNAFDHFANATTTANEIPVSRATKRLLKRGLLDVERGRRHIATGDFHSVRFYVTARVKFTARFIDKVERDVSMDLDEERKRLREINQRAQDVKDPPVIRYGNIDRVIKATNDTYSRAAELKSIANDLDQLYRDMRADWR